MDSLTRRFALKLIGIGSGWLGMTRTGSAQDRASQPTETSTPSVSWAGTHDRVWLGNGTWANPMEDWRVVDGAAECKSKGGNRSVHLLTHQITDNTKPLEMTVTIKKVESGNKDLGAGFRVGVRSDLNEYRSNCFAGGGINAGISSGELILAGKRKAVRVPESTNLKLTGRPTDGRYELTLTVTGTDGTPVGEITTNVATDSMLGNVALVNSYGNANKKNKPANASGGSRYAFRDWSVSGDAFTESAEHSLGPILWSMYSLSDSRSGDGFVMKISVLTGPLGDQDNSDVELMVEREGKWVSLGKAKLDPDAWTATMRIANWNEKIATPYKWVYREKHRDGEESEVVWAGTIKANPVGRPLRIGALTCQNDYGFPYAPVAENLLRLDPDMLYFSGDQLYESHGGFGIIRSPAEPAILNYLRKYYMFGWAFGEAMRDRPTLCLPDDHDVFQGNIWGEGGAPMNVKDGGASSNGGYIEPARMVNVVHMTNTAHHPDIDDPTPVEQNISVYYGDMVYGGVGFAILGDRQWKSGPQNVDTGSGRADHVVDPNFDCSKLDKPGLVLLGERQEKFLDAWGDDWRGHNMKILLSQTVFAGVATHHGSKDGYLKGDLDSGAWPQTARNRAIDILRKSKALHINGDQHLTTAAQYGVKKQRDSNWSFCTPAIAAGYPRWWRPDEVGMPHQNRPQHGFENTGEYLDGFGNKVYVYAVGNPIVPDRKKSRYVQAHQKGSGFGLVTVDTAAKTYTLDAFRFQVDATDGKPANQFPGWPITIHQDENAGQNRIK